MIEIRERYAGLAQHAASRDRLTLPFERRQKSRQRAMLASGAEVAIDLPRGQVLRDGDVLVASDARVVEVVAETETVVHVQGPSPQSLVRAAYHLGNRHVPVQVGEGWLRIVADRVLERMLEGLGMEISHVQCAFEPEAGAYGAHHRHDNESGHGGRIHEFGAR